MRVEGDHTLVPSKSAAAASTARARPSACASMTTLPGPKVEPDRAGPFGDQRDPPHRLGEGRRPDLRPAAELGREPRPVPDELTGDQPRDQPAAARLEADHAIGRRGSPVPGGLARPPASGWPAPNCYGHGRSGRHRPRQSARVLAGTMATALIPGTAGVQPELPDREPVAIGGRKRQGFAVDVQADRGEHRQRVVPARGRHDLAGSDGKRAAFDRAGRRRRLRQRRVVGEGKRYQLNSAPPQARLTMSPSELNSAGRAGRLRVISASRRPGTSAVPSAPATSASIRARAETS